jgi:hypothetical protein
MGTEDVMARFDGLAGQASPPFGIRTGTLRASSLGVAMALAWTALWSAFIVGVEAGAPAKRGPRPQPPRAVAKRFVAAACR